MRLIDTDRIKQNVINEMLKAEFNSSIYCTLECVIADIESQPTAFDLESVIEQIEKLPTKTIETYSNGYPVEEDFFSAYDVLEILKSAANATNGKNGG